MIDDGLIGARAGGPGSARRRMSRRHKLLTRSAPLVVVAAASFAGGLLLAAGPGRAERQLVTRYLRAWTSGETKAMYRRLDASSRAHITEAAFARQVRHTEATATATSMQIVHIGSTHGHLVMVSMTVQTRLWGRLAEMLELPVTGSGSSARIHLQSSMLFPGLTSGETLTRTTTMPTRATLLAADGTPLAEGADRTSPIPETASAIVGAMEAIPATELARYYARGYPTDTKIGEDGLEHVFQSRLAGTPGGTLYAGTRALATVQPIAGTTVKTTIVPAVEDATIAAADNRYAGITVINPRTGALEGLDGIAFSGSQPPGSTMKIITTVAALEAHLYTPESEFPVAASTTIDGYVLHNDDNEPCGGTLAYSFAQSCDPVFADVGVKVGAKRLVATAHRFGFNVRPRIPGASEPVIPSAAQIGDDLAVASSAIGQGKVLSTSLEQADVAATIADHGRRPIPTLLAGATPRFVRVTTAKVAEEVEQMMIAVVTEGTGTAAAIDGVQVAGKTGTAELTTTTNANNPKDTDSWFVGYAPAPGAKAVAAALFPASGYGASTAAPAVRDVLEAALGIS